MHPFQNCISAGCLSLLNCGPAVDSVIATAPEGGKVVDVLSLGTSCPPPIAVAIGGGGYGDYGGGGSGYITQGQLEPANLLSLQVGGDSAYFFAPEKWTESPLATSICVNLLFLVAFE